MRLGSLGREEIQQLHPKAGSFGASCLAESLGDNPRLSLSPGGHPGALGLSTTPKIGFETNQLQKARRLEGKKGNLPKDVQ